MCALTLMLSAAVADIPVNENGEHTTHGSNLVAGEISVELAGGAGRTAAVQTTAVSGPGKVHLEFLWEPVGAWVDLIGSQLRYPPAFLEWLPTTLGSWTTQKDTVVTYTCPNEPGVIEVCDAWVFFYNCAGCDPALQGGLPGLLQLSNDWERTGCGPSFTNGISPTLHKMKSFRSQLAPGESISFQLPGDAQFLAFGIDRFGVDCGKFGDASTCVATTNGRCKWDAANTKCMNQDCSGGQGQGPAQQCTECPADNLPQWCPGHWSGPLCDMCLLPYGGANCDECAPGLGVYPLCGGGGGGGFM